MKKKITTLVAATIIATLVGGTTGVSARPFGGFGGFGGFGPSRVVQGARPFVSYNNWVGAHSFVGSSIGRYYGGYPGSAAGWLGGRAIGGMSYNALYGTRYYYPRSMGIQTTTPYMLRPYGY